MLKKIFLFLTLLTSMALASEIEWAKDFRSAMTLAKMSKKPVMFVYSRHSCKYCVLLENTTFKDERVIKALNSDFISVVSYTDERDYTPRELVTPGTPAIWFLYSDAKPMFQPIMGAIDTENMLKALGIVQEEFKQNSK